MRDRRGWAALAGFAVVLVVVAPVQGSRASWTDRAALAGTSLRSGVLDVRVDGQDALSLPGLSASGLVPGDTSSRVVTVSNHGSTSLTYDVSLTGSNADARGLAGAVDLGVRAGAGGTCGTAVATPRTLAPGGTEQICLRLELPASAPVSVADAASDLTLTVRATDGGWTDSVPLSGISLSTTALTAPTRTCSLGLGTLTIGWAAVPHATAYRISYGLPGDLHVDTVAASVLTRTFSLVGATASVQAVFGSTTWVSGASATCG